MTKSHLIDGFADSLWNATASDAPATGSLYESHNCDVVIVGAGFTGLNAALKLASNGVKVCVLEAGQLGVGSSGRSGGQVNLGLNLSPLELVAKFGTEQGERLVQAVIDAPNHVFNLVREHALDCDAVQNGWVQSAINESYAAQQRKLIAEYGSFGLQLDALDKDELEVRTGTTNYIGGMYCSIAGSIQPLSYTREMARRAIELGVQLNTQSPVTQLVKSGNGWRVDTDAGQVNCATVLICTNAYTDGLIPGLKKTFVPVRSVLTATEPLSENMRESILPNQVTFVDKRRMILYFRYDRDGRLCVGDHGPSRDHFKLSDYVSVKKRAIAVFPELSNVNWDYHWGGRVAMTKDTLPFMHEIAPGLIAGMGYNGRGVAMGSKMGALLADHVLGTVGGNGAFPMTQPNKFALHIFGNIGVAATVSWYTLQDYLEDINRKS